MTKEDIHAIANEHQKAPHLRLMQKALAKDICMRVHSEEAYESAVKASQILFGKGSTELLKSLNEKDFLSIFEGVPKFELNKSDLLEGIGLLDLLADKTQFLSSKGEVRRAIKENSLSINQQKVTNPDYLVEEKDLLNAKYLLAQRGKKKKFLVVFQ